jgi:DNA-binding NarL/FixJ family response regulator
MMSKPPDKSKTRIVLVEDHPLFRGMVAQMINREDDMVVSGEADNLHDALEMIRSTKPDAAVVDITLKGKSGLDLIKDIKAQGLDVPILVLSMHDESLYAERVIRAGARGYITKYEAAEKVMSAIRKVIAGEIYLSENMTSGFLLQMAGARAVQDGPAVNRLTDRELEVFQLLGRGSSSREISEALNVGFTTVDTYRARIKEKLNLKSGTRLQYEAVQWVKKHA